MYFLWWIWKIMNVFWMQGCNCGWRDVTVDVIFGCHFGWGPCWEAAIIAMVWRRSLCQCRVPEKLVENSAKAEPSWGAPLDMWPAVPSCSTIDCLVFMTLNCLHIQPCMPSSKALVQKVLPPCPSPPLESSPLLTQSLNIQNIYKYIQHYIQE